MNYTKKSETTIKAEIKIKPASRPRYNARIQGEAIVAAARVSTKHDMTVYIAPTYYGWMIQYDKPTIVDGYYAITGRKVEVYQEAIMYAVSQAS